MSDSEKPLREATCKPLYQPWRQEEFRADLRVTMMSSVQRWMYRTILQEAFVCSSRPHLPDDDGQLWLLAGCDSQKVWEKNKDPIRAMFEEIEIDGNRCLKHKRLSEDWDRLLAKRKVRQDAGKRGGQASKPKQLLSKEEAELKQKQAREVEVEVEEKNKEKREVEDEPPYYDEEEEEPDMKAKREIPTLCLSILRTKAEPPTYTDVWDQITALAIRSSNGALVRDFEEWAIEHADDDFRGRPVSAFLRSLDNPRVVEVKQALEHPVVKAAGREITYITDGSVALDHKHKAILKNAVEEEDYTTEEVMVAFKDFYANLDTENKKKLGYAALNFVNEAPDRLYAVRRKKSEKNQEASAIARRAEEMQREAEAERVARQKAQEAESLLIESELPD